MTKPPITSITEHSVIEVIGIYLNKQTKIRSVTLVFGYQYAVFAISITERSVIEVLLNIYI